MLKFAFFITAISDYKAKMLELLVKSFNGSIAFYAGNEAFDSAVKVDCLLPVRVLKNVFLLRKRFLLQWPIPKQVIDSEVLILDLNPRIISVWIILLLRLFSRRKTVLYGHAFPRAGFHSRSRFFRYILVFLSTRSIVYSEQEIQNYPRLLKGKMTYCGNALYRSNQIYAADKCTYRNLIIFSGRLATDKNPFLILRAFEQFKIISKTDAVLVFFGDGELRQELEEYVRNSTYLSYGMNVKFFGYETDVETLRYYYDAAVCSVVPGFVGLQSVQSISFGVPVIFPFSNSNAPEVCYLTSGFNSIGFEEGNERQLVSILLHVFNNYKSIFDNNAIAEHAKKNVSLECMVEKFSGVLNGIASDS